MPPRSAKKASRGASAGRKTLARTSRPASKARSPAAEEVKAEEEVKVEEVKVEEVVEVREEVKVEEVIEEKVEDKASIEDSMASGPVHAEGDLGDVDNKVKVRARLSRPHQRGRGKRGIHGDIRIGRGTPRGGHVTYGRPPPHRLPPHGTRPVHARGAPIVGRGFKRPLGGYREKCPFMAVTERPRRLPPMERSYDRRPPIPAYHKSTSKRDYSRRDEPPPRNRAAIDYERVPIERRSSYRDAYSSRASGYPDIPPSAPRAADRRAYADVGYERKFERPPPSYRGRSRDYDSISGSKCPYSELVR